MTLIDFVNKYIKTKVDFDGVYGAQCVDLFRQYSKEVLEIKEHTGAVEGAKDLFLNYKLLPKEQEFFCRFDARNIFNPVPGSIAIWGDTKTNKYGHVAIVLSSTPHDIIVFEQNGFSQDGAKIAKRSRENLLGFLVKWENK